MVIEDKKMKNESFLVFSVQSSVYAIRSSHVVELIWLPELSRIESNSFFVIGYFNFRNDFVPVIDLNLRQGMKTKRYSVNDRILVITEGTKKIGIHINDIHNVIHFSYEKQNITEEILPDRITDGVIQTQFGITQIINIEALTNLNVPVDENKKVKPFSDVHLAKLFSGINEKDKQILISRKNNYSQSTNIKEYSNLLSVVVFRLKDEFLAIELKYILEFAHGEGITKIPCVPEHISGCINLRGDMLVLIDLLFLLKSEQTQSVDNKKIVVIRFNEMMIGLIVDQLIDVIYLSKEQILNNPPDKNITGENLMKGLCFYDSCSVGLIDTEKIFAYEKLYVEESIGY
jgi:purine-binding chemotaxis protein CheW